MIINSIKQLNLPSNDYIVIGSGILDALGLRQSGDIDLLISPYLYQQLKDLGWQEESNKGHTILTNGQDVEAWTDWDGQDYNAWLEHTTMIDDIKFVNLDQLKDWKTRRGLDKDLRDIELINHYLLSHD